MQQSVLKWKCRDLFYYPHNSSKTKHFDGRAHDRFWLEKPDSDFHVLISSTEPNPKQKLIYGWIICDTIVY